jgi:iron complex outermembrane receptor protein
MMLAAGAARADERTEARAHFKKGMASIADGRYESGVEELKKAYDILPHPTVLYNIARAYVDMGDLENAVAYYQKYLEGAPPDREQVAEVVAGLQARIRRQQARLSEAEQDELGGPSPPVRAPAPRPSAPPSVGPSAPAPSPEKGEKAEALAAREATQTGKSAAERAAEASAASEQVFEERVVTASKQSQSPLDAPSSTSIITEQDIRLSGIHQIPELLRRLAGVDIMQVTGSQYEVSMRGFNQRLSNRVLVLIDGRSIYTDLIGATLWAAIPYAVEDLERIEVVRGPGSALYGADAFNGVINLITKRPGTGGSGVNVGYGDKSNAHGTIYATGRDQELAYRLSAGYDYLPRWSREVPPGRADLQLFTNDQDASGRGERLNGEVTRTFGRDVVVGVAGGYETGFLEILGVGPINDQIIAGNNTQLSTYLQSKHFQARVFWNHSDGQNSNNAATIGQSYLPARFVNNVLDGEAQGIAGFETGDGIVHDLHVGVDYRLKDVTWTYQAEHETENHVGAFLHDAVTLGSSFAIVGDYRADYVPYLGRVVQSPRGSLLFHPTSKSTVRGTVATAFRTPTFLESYIGLPVQLPVAGASLVTPPNLPKLQPEQILTTEVGYMSQDSDLFSFDSALFYNHVDDLIQVAPDQALTVADLSTPGLNAGLNPSTGTYPVFASGFSNQCQSYGVYGAELGLRTFPAEGLDLWANYTLMSVKQDNSGCSPEQLALLVNDARTSAHKLNAGVQVRTALGFSGEIDLHYVSPQDWAEQVTDVQKQQIVYQSFHLDSYELVNARVGYRFLEDHAEASVVAFNLLGDVHREHPFGQLVDRRVMGFFSYKF